MNTYNLPADDHEVYQTVTKEQLEAALQGDYIDDDLAVALAEAKEWRKVNKVDVVYRLVRSSSNEVMLLKAPKNGNFEFVWTF